MRVHTMQGAMSLQQADILEAYLNRTPGVTKATVYDRTGDAVICYDCPRTAVVKALSSFAYANEQALAPEQEFRFVRTALYAAGSDGAREELFEAIQEEK